MHHDVVDLRSFYYRTKLGRTAARLLGTALRDLWPDTRHMTVAGFGFAAPLLGEFRAGSRRVLSLMPAQQGVMPWPPDAPNVSVLVEETNWPLPAGFVDRLVLAHGLETCERPNALLEEAWRVLAPQGQIALVVPNRAGLWARAEGTPFGVGRPYSSSQLERLLRQHDFIPERHRGALWLPPSQREFWLGLGGVWERVARRLDAQVLAGTLIVTATKQVYVTPRRGSPVAAVKGPLEVLEGLTQPAPKPATGRAPRLTVVDRGRR